MNDRLKVMTVVGTRPEIIRLAPTIKRLDRYTRHVLVHTGQNYDYELNEIFFNDLGIRRPDRYLKAAGATPAQTIAQVIARADAAMEEERPDAVLLLGDTNSCLAVIAAKRRKIPIFHMEAGNRCFDQRVPEEVNRRIVDHTSDINLTYTEHARRYLLSEGLRPETVIKSGSPMKEVLDHQMPKIKASGVLDRLRLSPEGYFVVSAHREENIESEENFTALMDSLNAVARRYGLPLVFSTHPRTRARLKRARRVRADRRVRFLKPLGFSDYVRLQMGAKCVLSDSGTITEESSILDFPAVMLRQAHERPEGMDEGALVMSGLGARRVIEAVNVVTANRQKGRRSFRVVEDYDVPNVSAKILRVILSYVGYVDRTVWRKQTL